MSNVEQGIMNVEVRMFLLDCFGANNAHKWNLNRFSFLHYSTFPVRHSTLNQYVQWLNCIISMVSLFCIAPSCRVVTTTRPFPYSTTRPNLLPRNSSLGRLNKFDQTDHLRNLFHIYLYSFYCFIQSESYPENNSIGIF